jgi:hypothetical protein
MGFTQVCVRTDFHLRRFYAAVFKEIAYLIHTSTSTYFSNVRGKETNIETKYNSLVYRPCYRKDMPAHRNCKWTDQND